MKKVRIISMLVALVLVVGCLSACGAKKGEADGDVVLTWYFIGETDKEGRFDVYDAANAILKEKTGVTVDFQPIEPSAYEDKIKMIISGGEDYDICWASNWRNDYAQNVSNGSFLAIDEYLKDAPELVASMNENTWNATKIDNKIYGVPCQQIMAHSTGFYIPKQYNDIFEEKVVNPTKYSDLTEYVKTVGEKNPDFAEIKINWQYLAYLYNIQPLIGTYVPGAIKLDAETGDLKVFNQFDSDEWKDAIFTRESWTKNGYTAQGLASGSKTTYKEGELPLLLSAYKPGGDVDTLKTYKFENVMHGAGELYLTSTGVNASLQCINVNSKHPEEAIKVLQEVNTNPELINLLTYGILGRDYEFVDENAAEAEKTVRTLEDSQYSSPAWRMGNELLTYVSEGQDPAIRQETIDLNNNAKPSPVLGFSVNTEPISLEIANCTSVIKEYYNSFEQGIGDIEKLQSEMISKLEQAGVQNIIDELQKQLDEWQKAQ